MEQSELKKRFLKAKRKLFESSYKGLNPEQRQAVFTVNDPLLILAGAGSGKTTVLVKRIAFIIRYGNAYMTDDLPFGTELSEEYVNGIEKNAEADIAPETQYLCGFAERPCAPWQMLAITFTNKAANEIKQRLSEELHDENISNDIWAGTFHSVCLRILRSHADKLGYRSGFTIYDADDTKKAIGTAIKECNIDDKLMPVKTAVNAISRAKEQLISADDYLHSFSQSDHKSNLIFKIYKKYQEMLMSSNAMDFDDIIMNTVILLRDFEDVRNYYQNKFRYVSVDEFQDTNKAQLFLTELLSGKYRNLMVVGDDDQSIYRFRGATIENILNFDRTYPDANVIRLEQNYRSTDVIVGAANSVIKNNEGRHSKTLRTDKTGGELITVRRLIDQNDEARYIVDTVRRNVQNGSRSFKDYAVLYRTNAQSNVIERSFARAGIPYRMLGGTRFNEREEIRDITAYLQLISNHSDRERLLRIINKPRRKIGNTTIDAISELAAYENKDMFEIIEHADKYVSISRSAKQLMSFAAVINELTEMMSHEPLDSFVKLTMEKTGYRRMLEERGEEEKDRLDNLDEFVSGVIEYMKNDDNPTLSGFLEENALVTDIDKYDESADAVVMMTIHSAKGLEFPVVMIPGMEEGIFPGMQTLMEGPGAIEEERRLAYVAITRAKEELYILSVDQRMLYGRTTFNPPSRFLKEIPDKYIDSPRKSFSDTSAANVYGGMQRELEGTKTYVSGGEYVPMEKAMRSKQTVNIAVGDRVRHFNFGDGTVISVTPVGVDFIYEVIFDRVGIKKLMATYAKLKKI